MNPKINAPAFPPQILLDQFQRPVAPIPGMSQLDYFALQIYCQRTIHRHDNEALIIKVAELSIQEAKILLNALHVEQSETQIETLKIISDES